MPYGKGTYGSKKGRPSKKKKGYMYGGRLNKYGGGIGMGIETTDQFQVPEMGMPGRVMGMAPKKPAKTISSSKQYSKPPSPLAKNLGQRDRFSAGGYTTGGTAKPN